MSPLPDIHNYLPVNDNAMRWGLYLTGIGRATTPPDSRYPRTEHPDLYDFRWEQGRELPEFAVLLISEGEGVFETRMAKRFRVEAGSLMFVFPGVWHRYRPERDTGWTERWICFNGELAHRLLELSLLQADVPVRRVADAAFLVQCFEGLFEKVLLDPARNSIVLSLHTLGLLGTLIDAAVGSELPGALEYIQHGGPAGDTLVSQALTYIWTRGHKAISIQRIADHIGVTQRTLERRFQQEVGHSIMEEIIRCRLNRAKRLLQETGMRVKTVAHLAGFPSVQRMRVAFTQREHVSPLAFRRRGA
jgi:AraC-like DNA-binding protein